MIVKKSKVCIRKGELGVFLEEDPVRVWSKSLFKGQHFHLSLAFLSTQAGVRPSEGLSTHSGMHSGKQCFSFIKLSKTVWMYVLVCISTTASFI